MSPFQYQSFKNAGHLKYVYTAMIIVGVLLPCVSAGVNVGFGYGILSFSPMVCVVAVQDVGFYTDGLFEGFEVAILGTLQALVFLMLVKVGHHYILVSIIPRPSVPCTKDLGMSSISCIMHEGVHSIVVWTQLVELLNLAHTRIVLIVCSFIELVELPSLSAWT